MSRVDGGRRRVLLGAGALGIAALGSGCQPLLRAWLTRYDNSEFEPTSYSFEDDARCLATAPALDGPYAIDGAPLRSDIREGLPGAPLRLRLEVVDAAGCAPIAGAAVEVWQCDAEGRYSGHVDADTERIPLASPWRSVPPTDGERFLRGAQVADDEGFVEFQTIVPGWYAPRVQHVHAVVRVGGRRALGCQLYFPDEVLDEVARSEPYRRRGPSPYTRHNDVAIHDSRGADGGWLRVEREPGGWYGSLTLGVRA